MRALSVSNWKKEDGVFRKIEHVVSDMIVKPNRKVVAWINRSHWLTFVSKLCSVADKSAQSETNEQFKMKKYKLIHK